MSEISPYNQSTCDQRAQDWKAAHGVTYNARFIGHQRFFPDDKESRDVYEITLQRGSYTMIFRFGQAIARSDGKGRKPPTLYDVLACITKHDPGTFEEFCSDFGGDTDSRKNLDTYLAVQKEYNDFQRLCRGSQVMLEDAQEIN